MHMIGHAARIHVRMNPYTYIFFTYRVVSRSIAFSHPYALLPPAVPHMLPRPTLSTKTRPRALHASLTAVMDEMPLAPVYSYS